MVYGKKEGLVICGRYHISTEEEIIEINEIMEEINRRYANRPEHAMIKSGEIFPANIVPVIALEDNQAQASLFKWGFPSWKSGGVVINARSETVLEKPMFRQAFVNRRCVIPSTGFYEWKKKLVKRRKTNTFFIYRILQCFIWLAYTMFMRKTESICQALL